MIDEDEIEIGDVFEDNEDHLHIITSTEIEEKHGLRLMKSIRIEFDSVMDHFRVSVGNMSLDSIDERKYVGNSNVFKIKNEAVIING